jgi:acetyl esterase/lipase
MLGYYGSSHLPMTPTLLRSHFALLFALPVAIFAQPSTVNLWSDPAKTASSSDIKETWTERGKNGVVDRGVTFVSTPDMTVYLPLKEKNTGVGIILCPGGGYEHLAIDKEGHDVAKWLNSIGVAGFVLKYRLPRSKGMGYTMEAPLQDAQRALRMVRTRAEEWHLDASRIGMMGFSAGGDLVARAGMSWDKGQSAAADPVERASCRPDFLVLAYPALPKELHVTADTPPAFLVQASNDPTVSPENSTRFYLALLQAKVPAELHIYLKGGHGFGMVHSVLPTASWPLRLEDWMTEQGILRKQ